MEKRNEQEGSTGCCQILLNEGWDKRWALFIRKQIFEAQQKRKGERKNERD